MIPSKSKGWMVNFSVRRVEPVEAEESPFNTPHYGRYRGPRRTYMLHEDQVFDTELEALADLQSRMTKRYGKLADQLTKYLHELKAVDAAIKAAMLPDCTTCHGRRTVPLDKHIHPEKGWVRDCPDCCGEEG